MFNIFAAIRIALMPGSEYAEVMIQIINDMVLPELDQRIAKAKKQDPDSVADLENVRELWIKYSDPRSPDARYWRNISYTPLYNVGERYRKLQHLLPDIESESVEALLRGDKMQKIFDKIDIMAGPKAFGGYWSGVVGNSAENRFRHVWDHSAEKQKLQRVEETEDDEGKTVSVLEQIESPKWENNMDIQEVGDIKKLLDDDIESKFGKNPIAMATYKLWISMIERKGPEHVNFKHDVIPPLMEYLKKNKKLSKRQRAAKPSEISRLWKNIKDEIVHFIERRPNIRFTQKLRETLKVAEIIAIQDFYTKFANWVLGYRRFSP